MNLAKTSFWTGIATAIKLLSGFVINKFIAVFIGSDGLAVIGQFRDFQGILYSIGGGGIQQGIVKYTSEYKNDKKKLIKLISTGFTLTLIVSLIIGLSLILFNNFFTKFIFNSNEYYYILIVCAITLPLFTLNTFFLSILNGVQEIKKFIAANISSSLVGLILTSTLIYLYDLQGALFALVTNQSIIVFLTMYFLFKSKLIDISFFRLKIHRANLKKLSNFSLMFIVSAFTVPLVTIAVRKHIGTELSWEQAGYWEAIWRLSEMMLMFLSVSFSTYLLPKFSESNNNQLQKEVLNALKFVIPISILICTVVYLLREYITIILFSEKFVSNMNELFLFQMVGNVFKISTWVFGNIIIAKAKTLLFILIQIGWGLIFLVLSYLFINEMGLKGVTVSFALSYLLYLIFLIFYFKNLLWKQKTI